MAAHVTPKQRKEILRLQAAGHSNLAIAEQLGIDRHTVGRHAEPKPRNVDGEPPLSADELLRVRYLVANIPGASRCHGCKKQLYYARNQLEGFCNWCGVEWTLVAPSARKAQN